MENFKVGDTVKVINNRQIYTTFEDMVIYLTLINWEKGKEPYNGDILKIINFSKHFYSDDIIVAIEDKNGKQYLIDKKGLELYQSDKYYMVHNPNNRQPYKMHNSREEAEKEANRLALIHIGEKFYVLEATTVFYAEKPEIKKVEMT